MDRFLQLPGRDAGQVQGKFHPYEAARKCPRALLDKGAHVFILDRDEARGKELASELGSRVDFVHTDVTVEEQVREALSTAASAGNLRIAVNCAAIGIGRRVIDRSGEPHDLESFDRVLRVNLFGTFNVMRYQGHLGL